MTGRQANLLLATTAGLILALAPTPARALLILDGTSHPLQAESREVQALADELLGSVVEDQSMSLADPPAGPDRDSETQQILRRLNALIPTGGCQSSTTPQSNGPGPSTSAVTGDVQNPPPPPLQTPLANEGRPILPTGPPFELLRPPRAVA